jgi:hypothetical protein
MQESHSQICHPQEYRSEADANKERQARMDRPPNSTNKAAANVHRKQSKLALQFIFN